MTIEEAMQECQNIDVFCHMMCIHCTTNNWFCPTYCNLLIKARRMPFDKILKSYARNDGDPANLSRYIKRYKERN